MSQYKLTYFNSRAKAEVARLLFEIAGVAYEDDRIQREKWPELKPGKIAIVKIKEKLLNYAKIWLTSTPYGQIPVLEVDGKQLCQSNSIARYLANKFGLAGKNDWEKAQADMIVDCIEDIVNDILDIAHEHDVKRKQELTINFKENKFQTYLNNLEKLLKQNQGGDGFFVGDSLTWADLALFNLFGWASAVGLSVPLEEIPKLKALKERVEQLPKVAEWVAKRPQTQF